MPDDEKKTETEAEAEAEDETKPPPNTGYAVGSIHREAK
jgi:hypothetical protein